MKASGNLGLLAQLSSGQALVEKGSMIMLGGERKAVVPLKSQSHGALLMKNRS